MATTNVCRLCSSADQLTDIYDPRLTNSEQLRFYFLLATGLQIREDDIVSKMVCHRCCAIAVKLHKYRASAVANDKLLKERCGQAYTAPTTDQDELRRLSAQILTSNGKMFAAPLGLPPDGRLLLMDAKNAIAHEALDLLNVCVKTESVDDVVKPEPYKHQSVKDLYKTYSNIILPESVYPNNVAPVVMLDESEVEEWAEEEFQRVQQKLSWTKIIIQKVGEGNKAKKNEIVLNKSIQKAKDATVKQIVTLPTDPNLIKKRPGPKSRTVPSLSLVVKPRPGPKSKTLKNETVQASSVPVTNEITTYRPGPKSRKSELVIKEQLPQKSPVLQEGPKQMTTRSCKSVEVVNTPRLPRACNISKIPWVELNSHLESDDDDDFDGSGFYMDSDDSFEGQPASANKQAPEIVNSTSSNNSDLQPNCEKVLPKTNEVKAKRGRPCLTSRRRTSSAESEISNSSRKRKAARPEIDNQIETKSKNCRLEAKISNDSKNEDVIKPDKKERPTSTVNSVVAQKGNKVYMCHKCCGLFATSKELSKHQKSHLICEYCNYRMKNLETLRKHQRDICLAKRKKDQPMLTLTKVDEIKSIVNKYPEAFDGDNDTNKRRERFKVKIQVPLSDKPTEQQESAKPIQLPLPIQEMTKSIPVSNQEASIPTPELPLIQPKCEVVSLSDESDDEVQIVNDIPIEPKSFVDLPLSVMTENDMIRSLFDKHLKNDIPKLQNASQTFLPRSEDIKYTSANLIVIHNLFYQLHTYKIPVQLEIQPKISARFTSEVTPSPNPIIETWSHIKPIQICKPKKIPNLAPKPVWIAPAKLNTKINSQTTKPPGKNVLNSMSSDHSAIMDLTGDPQSNFQSSSISATLSTTAYVSTQPTFIFTKPQGLVLPSNVSQNNMPFLPNIQPIILPQSSLEATDSLILSTTNTETNVNVNLINSLTTQGLVTETSPSTNNYVSTQPTLILTKPQDLVANISQSILPTSQAIIMPTTAPLSMSKPSESNNPGVTRLPKPQNNTPKLQKTNILLNTSPSHVSKATLIANSNLFTSNPFLSAIPQDKNQLLSLVSTSNPSPPNMTTTLIQTANNATVVMQNGISSNSTTIIQTPNNSTFIQTPNAAVIQSSSNANIDHCSLANSASASSQNSVVLMQQQQTTNSTNNFIFPTQGDQIYINNNDSNKVVVFSNTLQQNMPLYAAPYLGFEPPSISIEEIEDTPSNGRELTTLPNKNGLRVKPRWDLF